MEMLTDDLRALAVHLNNAKDFMHDIIFEQTGIEIPQTVPSQFLEDLETQAIALFYPLYQLYSTIEWIAESMVEQVRYLPEDAIETAFEIAQYFREE